VPNIWLGANGVKDASRVRNVYEIWIDNHILNMPISTYECYFRFTES
jgi:hypothetical protein